MEIIVQKYGGTSVNTSELRDIIYENLVKVKESGDKPVIVVSAMGRKGDPYATDSLLHLINDRKGYTREMDMLISCGEIISAAVVASHLREKGVKAIALSGGQAGILTDDTFGNSRIIEINPHKVLSLLEDGFIPVITGFQGITAQGDVTTLGRGGSDVSAVAIGAALKARWVEIFTDVDGVMSADPKIVKDAKLINTINYDEVFQLAEYGGKVIHPRAVEYAMNNNLTIKVLNARKYSTGKGTLISGGKVVNDDMITAIAHEHGKIQIKINMNKISDDIFDKIACKDISIDMINIFTDHAVFIINNTSYDNLEHLLLENGIDYHIEDECTKITLIGNKIRGVPGVMASVISSLKGKIEVLQTSDSHMTISLLVKTAVADEAINMLHARFKSIDI
ncbi:MAG: aspartate kinase [Eubacteriaceae bacterium]|nr:aspartate kinase [Eubacteriaceae bacterium]